MKTRISLLLIILLIGIGQSQIALSSESSNVNSQFDSLGSTEDLVQKSKALDPENKVRVVQKRKVDRNLRFELAGHYGMINGGDSYILTQNAGVQLEFHFTPKWSLGVRYDNYFSRLTEEGQKAYDEADAARRIGANYRIPEVDYPLSSQLATLSWYPIYGKLNLFDSAITQFDLYFLAGGGSLKLNSGNANLTTFGGGMGFWFTQHFAMRFELREQSYLSKAYADTKKLDTFVMNMSMGFLL